MYRGGGLAYFENVGGPQAEKIRIDVIKVFKQELDLSITSETNLKIFNFLDVTLNLSTGKYQRYNKPENDPKYIDFNSNHPPSVTENFPDSISTRINNLLSDEHVFNSRKNIYDNASRNSGYKQNIKFQHNVFVEVQKRKSNRGRKTICFSLSYSRSVATNTDKKFFLLLDKHLPKNTNSIRFTKTISTSVTVECQICPA